MFPSFEQAECWRQASQILIHYEERLASPELEQAKADLNDEVKGIAQDLDQARTALRKIPESPG